MQQVAATVLGTVANVKERSAPAAPGRKAAEPTPRPEDEPLTAERLQDLYWATLAEVRRLLRRGSAGEDSRPAA